MNKSTLVPREEMSDLDWLARNVYVWVHGQEYTYVMKDQDENRSVSVFAYHSFYSKFSRYQWLARRAELQNKPSWNDLPDWAMWISQDASGNWWIYETEPKSILDCRGGSHWSCNDGSCESLLNYSGEVIGDHLDTLEKRPEQKAFDPFVSVEDAATAKQPAPKGSGNPILGMVLADLTNRALEGKEKYGEPLLAHNGRNPLWDAYQEALDLAMYLRQAIEEQSEQNQTNNRRYVCRV